MVWGMGSLWRSGSLGCFALFVGCTGRTVEGLWVGPLPFSRDLECRIRLMKAHRFDFACGEPGEVSGVGDYSFERGTLTLNFERFIRDGRVLDRNPSGASFAVSGPGNAITLRSPTGQRYEWRRSLE